MERYCWSQDLLVGQDRFRTREWAVSEVEVRVGVGSSRSLQTKVELDLLVGKGVRSYWRWQTDVELGEWLVGRVARRSY